MYNTNGQLIRSSVVSELNQFGLDLSTQLTAPVVHPGIMGRGPDGRIKVPSGGGILFKRGSSDWFVGADDGSKIRFQLGSNIRMIIQPDGNVSIDTTNLGSYRLAVNGTIRAKEVRVNTGWSDFVFEEDYSLPTLSEVESHIKAHKHLPDIPSAAEVEAEGVELGVISSKLLQKVEELTLYVIAQEKRIAALEAENAVLRE